MDDEAPFNSVTWEREDQPNGESDPPATTPSRTSSIVPIRSPSSKRRQNSSDEAQAGPDADGVDLAGVGDGVLECTVDTPMKENDGTKDAYMSYLVTSHVSVTLSRDMKSP